MDKLKMHSPDQGEANLNKLAELFPGCVTEVREENTGRVVRAVDFDRLRQEFSSSVLEGPRERYQLDWPGKREAILLAGAPIAKTLRPTIDESVNFASTRNLFIEGDNLDALKLLQETYLGRVRVIYIDPPYNTGGDFIYRDTFSEEADDYLRRTGQVEDSGARMVANPESNGRFHSEWLSMMLPRLKLARNLIRDDGIIFISIDDHELGGLKLLCDEVFGPSKLVGIFKWNRTSKAPTLSPKIRGKFEYVLCYEKVDVGRLVGPESYNEAAPLLNSGNQPSRLKFAAGTVGFRFEDGLYPKGIYGKGDKAVHLHDDIEVVDQKNKLPFEMTARFKWSQSTVDQRLSEGQRLFFKTSKFATMYYELSTGNGKRIAPSDLLSQDECGVLRNDEGYLELKGLFDDVALFDYAKPVSLMKYLVRMVDDPECIVLDFFAGSSSTAHAVFELNAEDGGSRRFIMVQVPQPCDPASAAFKAGFGTISELSRERIRRAGGAIAALTSTPSGIDLGFRALRVDTSNLADIYYFPDALQQNQLLLTADNIKPDRSPNDLLFQVLVDWGVDLTLPIECRQVSGRQVFVVDGDALVACFETGIDEALVRELAKLRPLRAVFRDGGYASDSTKINVEQVFKLLSPETEVRSL
jgi:adenine-specific DNA-methyltransferase